MKKLSKDNKAFIDEMGNAGLAQLLPDLYLLEMSDFYDWTVEEVIDLILSKAVNRERSVRKEAKE